LVIVIVILVSIACLLLPIIPVDETYETYETYDRRLKYKVVSAKCKDEIEFPGLECAYVSEVILKNIDEHDGTFTVTHYYEDVTGHWNYRSWTKTTSRDLEPGESGTFRIQFSHNWMMTVKGNYKVSAPTVQDSRLVTRHKTCHKSIIGILLEVMQHSG